MQSKGGEKRCDNSQKIISLFDAHNTPVDCRNLVLVERRNGQRNHAKTVLARFNVCLIDHFQPFT